MSRSLMNTPMAAVLRPASRLMLMTPSCTPILATWSSGTCDPSGASSSKSAQRVDVAALLSFSRTTTPNRRSPSQI